MRCRGAVWDPIWNVPGRFIAAPTSLAVVNNRTGIIVRGRARRRPRRLVVIGGALGALIAAAGCGSTGYNTAALAHDITSRLDQHPGFAVASVHCPAHARRAKGVVVHCSATLRNGDVVRLRATQLDDSGTIHLVADEMFADNVQRGILASLPRGAPGAQAVCPNHVPVVIGAAFTCRVRDAGAYTRARVMIVDADGGFRVRFS